MAGWWWSNEDTTSKQPTTSQHEHESIEPPSAPQPPLTSTPTSTTTSQPRSAGSQSASARIDQLNRDDSALEELKAAFASLSSDPNSTSPSTTTTSSTHPSPSPDDTDPASHNTSLYPSTLSCSQCFDAAYYCSSIGGQLNSVYRYGGLRSCSDLWAQWRFCMRTKTMGEEERRRRVWEWNREKEARRRVGRSSEEVWSLRTEGVPEGALGLWEGRGGGHEG